MTGVFALMWLISSSAWANGVTDVKYYSNPNEWYKRSHISGCNPSNCTIGNIQTGNFASLNVSIVSVCLGHETSHRVILTSDLYKA